MPHPAIGRPAAYWNQELRAKSQAWQKHARSLMNPIWRLELHEPLNLPNPLNSDWVGTKNTQAMQLLN